MANMEGAGDSSSKEDSLLAIFREDIEESGKVRQGSQENEKMRKPQDCESKKTKMNPDEKTECDVCGGIFTYREFSDHKKTNKHKLARQNQKRERRRHTHESGAQAARQIASASIPYSQDGYTFEEVKFLKEKYYIRKGVELPEQQLQYQNTLATFLVLRFLLSSHSREIKFSMNNDQWGKFGDIVIETVDEKETKIEAIQCKQIQIRSEISVPALSAQSGKFSIREISLLLQKLRKRENYHKTYFKLFTVSSILMEDNLRFTYDSALVDTWKKNERNEEWKGREVVVAQYKKKNLLDTTDDPDNICIFKIVKGSDELMDQDLNKFSLFTNQKKTNSLKHHIRMMIEDKFDLKKDLSNDIIKYVSEYFDPNRLYNYHYSYKLTNRDVLLKIAELILTSYILFPESTVESRTITKWDETISKFDVIVIKNHYDITHKIYSSINMVLNRKIGRNIDTSVRHITVEKDDIKDNAMKSEIFDGYLLNTRKVSLHYLYVALWKIEEAPLLLTVDNEANLQLILKIITFLKSENLSCKFILATSCKIHHSSFPGHLNTFINLADLGKTDERFLEEILVGLQIPVLDFSVNLKEIVDLNDDFLKKVTPDALLNMCLHDYSLKNVFVPMTDDIIDNTLVFSDETIGRIKEFFQKAGNVEETNNLSYVVNMEGSPSRIEIPPDI